MKPFIIFLVIISCIQVSYAQNNFKKAINEASLDIADKLTKKGKKSIVVLYITDASKSQTTIGNYIADVISIDIVNHPDGFQVFDRDNLSSIVEAKKLIWEGYIDAVKAKEIGSKLKVDAILVGNYVVLNTTLEINIKALDVNNGLMIAATNKELPVNDEAAALLGVNIGSGNNKSNKGFNNRPLNSNEEYNNPETVNKECYKNNTGDYCFKNTTTSKFLVQIASERIPTHGFSPKMYQKLTLSPDQTQCFYDMEATKIFYKIKEKVSGYPYKKAELLEGQLMVDKCKSKTFSIK